MYVCRRMDEWMDEWIIIKRRGDSLSARHGFPLTSFLFFCSLVAEDNTH